MAFDRNSFRAWTGGRGEGFEVEGGPFARNSLDSGEDLIDTGRCRSAKLCKVAAAGFSPCSIPSPERDGMSCDERDDPSQEKLRLHAFPA